MCRSERIYMITLREINVAVCRKLLHQTEETFLKQMIGERILYIYLLISCLCEVLLEGKIYMIVVLYNEENRGGGCHHYK